MMRKPADTTDVAAALAGLLALPAQVERLTARVEELTAKLAQGSASRTLPVPEAAKELGVSEASVWRAIRKGTLKTVLVSARCRRVVMPTGTELSSDNVNELARKARAK